MEKSEKLKIVVHPNRILVRKIEHNITKGGIIIPSSVESPNAEVVHVGKNVTWPKQGDTVMLRPFGPSPVYTVNGEKLLLVEPDEVALVIG